MIIEDLWEAKAPKLPSPFNPRGINPALMTLDEYLKLVNKNGTWHPSEAYDVGLEQLNSYNADPKTYPILLRRAKINGLEFEIRMQAEKRTYLAYDDEKDTHIRDEHGNTIPLTPDEVAAKGYRPEEFTIAIFDEDGKRVAAAQDEWNCMLIRVAREYRGFGLGPLLGKIARTFEPAKSSGGFTPAGYANFIKVHRAFVCDALHAGLYRRLLRDGEMTIDRVREIIQSAHLERRPKGDRFNLSTKDPADWLLLAEYGGFTLYDRKLKDIYQEHLYDFGERFIKGHALVRVIERRGAQWGLFVQFGGDSDRIKAFLLHCAASWCAGEGATLMVDPDDMKYVNETDFEIGEPNMATGYRRTPVTIRRPINVEALGKAEQAFRRGFDRYKEFKQIVLELGDSKYRD